MKETIKFYADAPDGTKNKLLIYKVKDIENSIELLERFIGSGWQIRRAYHHFENGIEIPINKNLINKEHFNKEPELQKGILKRTPKI